MNNKLSSLIYLIIKKASYLGKTKLVKLIYLMDYEHFKAFGNSITKIDYFYYHYGPYSDEISKYINELGKSKIILETRNISSFTGRVFCTYCTLGGFEYDKYLGADEIDTANYILQKYGNEQLEILLDITYDTVPMKNVKSQGDHLKFENEDKNMLKNLRKLKDKIKTSNPPKNKMDWEESEIPKSMLDYEIYIAAKEQ